MSLFPESIPQFVKMLRNMDNWLTEAEAYADSRKFDVNVLLSARLYPDMMTLTRQIQSACDTAKFVGSRLTGKDAPSHPDTETTFAELHERIASTAAYLEGFTSAEFEGVESKQLFLPFLKGGWVSGQDYLREFAVPNFYFHAMTAYALLRSNGVQLGKMKYIGSMNIHAPE